MKRQETSTKFVISLVPIRIRCIDVSRDPINGPLQEELASVRGLVSVMYMNWIKRSNNDEPQGFIRIYIPEAKAVNYPTFLRVVGEAVTVQIIRKR